MSNDAELVLEKVKNLSVGELLTVQESIIQELRHKTSTNGNGKEVAPSAAKTEPATGRIHLAHAIRRTPEEIEASLAEIFTPEELAKMGKTDFDKLPQGSKSASEMLIEDREDRF